MYMKDRAEAGEIMSVWETGLTVPFHALLGAWCMVMVLLLAIV